MSEKETILVLCWIGTFETELNRSTLIDREEAAKIATKAADIAHEHLAKILGDKPINVWKVE